MEQSQFEALLAHIDEQVSIVTDNTHVVDTLRQLLDANKENLTPDQEQQLSWEYLLFRLRTKNRYEYDGLKTERFVPMVTYLDGRVFPDPNSFPEAAFEYFETRSESARSPILKARYLDFIWEKSKLKTKHLSAIKAVEEYLLSVEAYQLEDAIFERLDALQRAMDLALMLEGKKSAKPLADKVVVKLNAEISRNVDNENYRPLIELFELVLAAPSFYSQQQVSYFLSLCETAAAQYHSNQNFILERRYIELKGGLRQLNDSTDTPKEELHEEIAQSLLDEAEAKSESGLVKVHFLELAIDHYKKLGDRKKVDELTVAVK